MPFPVWLCLLLISALSTALWLLLWQIARAL
jgi:hypothetical protein